MLVAAAVKLALPPAQTVCVSGLVVTTGVVSTVSVAAEVGTEPQMSVKTHSTRCTHTPMGVKGCGEVGTIGSNLASDIYHTERMWASTCEVTNLILKEWHRRVAGNPSCPRQSTTVIPVV